ncbi:phage tail protein [Xanthobacter sp. VTT E-85241]|uniref:TipJ family phage tail tip protein n=1 Tax=Roseixanthobacter finlandensis TaxID=3119922 RepID=UPI00372A4CC6
MLLPGLDVAQRVSLCVPAGATIGEIVAIAVPEEARRAAVRVTIGDHVIEQAVWHRVTPREGAQVIVRLIPGDNGLLRSALMIAVVIAAAAVSGGALAPLGTSLGLGGALAQGSIGATIAAAGTAIAGNILVNALVPIRQDSIDKTASSPTYSIQGLKNVANPDGVVPRLLGEMRYAPVYAATPYTEVIGNDRYVIASFNFGYGPLALRNFKIGDTPIDEFVGVEIEVREGYPDDDPLSLYPQQVIEDALSINVRADSDPYVRVTASDVTKYTVDIGFGQGLFAVNKSGAKIPAVVQIGIRYRPAGSDDAWTTEPPMVVVGIAQQPFSRSYSGTFPARGQYEVETARQTIDFDTTTILQATGRSDWTALRSYRPEYPLNFDKPMALVAVRIKATDQLNGMLDSFNAEACSILPDWDTGTQAWVTRETRNPAAHFRHVLTGNAIAYPFSTSEMDALEDWHEFCDDKGLTYDRVHDYEASVGDVLGDIAAAGRAVPQDRGSKWGVVIDQIQDIVRGHVSPRNSWGFKGSRSFVRLPDAFRVKFKDETFGYVDAERVVPRPGFVGDPQVTEELSLPGITNPDLIWKEARRRFYELQHRADTYEAYQDFEHLVVTRGDLVKLSHDVLDRTQIAARVKFVVDDFVELDELVTMEAGLGYACRFRLSDGTSVLRSVYTGPGTTQTIRLTGSGAMPEVGDLAFFGLSSQETFDLIVKGVEVGDDLTAKLTYVDHAPQIQTLTDADTPPAWNGRVGTELDPSTVAPGVPVISSVVSGVLAGADAVVVGVIPGSGIVVPVSYDIRHRLTGAGSWSGPVTISAGDGGAYITGYAKGDDIDLSARATSASAISSAYSATVTHEVGATDPTIQDVDTFSAAWNGSTWLYEWAFETLADGMDEAAGIKIRYGSGTSLAWDDLEPLHTGVLIVSPWDMSVPPPLAPTESYTFGAVTVTGAGDLGTPVLITVTA